jgi:hypothetical protein
MMSPFGIADVQQLCPSMSRDTIRLVMNRRRRQGKLEMLCKGRDAKWQRTNKKQEYHFNVGINVGISPSSEKAPACRLASDRPRSLFVHFVLFHATTPQRPLLFSWTRSRRSRRFWTKCIASWSPAGGVSPFAAPRRASCGAAAPTSWPAAR